MTKIETMEINENKMREHSQGRTLDMKKLTLGLLIAALGLILASTAMAYTGTYTGGQGINATPHDLSRTDTGMNYAINDGLNRICIYCHAPHNTYRLNGTGVGSGDEAPIEFDYLPLWNHNVTGFNATYQPYENGPGAPQTGPKASQAILGGMTIGSGSLLCLSCHDGSIAVNSYGNPIPGCTTASGGTTTIAQCYQIGKDKYLGNHHPIGFSYTAVWSQDNEIREASSYLMTPATYISDHLYNDNLECGSCHSVHNTGNMPNAERLLWRSDQNSELCLTCHAKGLYTAP
jgi:predicted CXXCH cytochrome family protein